MKNRFLAPAYDVVNTVIYFPDDKPALSLFGKKIWLNRKKLLEFATEYCLLDKSEAQKEFDTCLKAIETIKLEIKTYIAKNYSFKEFGEKFLKILNFSLNENIKNSYKDISNGIL